MTDNEIIKALECCITNKCDGCAIYKECHNENGKGRVQVVLDLIKRQQAEIEKLKDEKWLLEEKLENAERLNDSLGDDIDNKLKVIYKLHEQIKSAKSEAIKEFAERLNGILKKKRKNEQTLFVKTRYGECILAVDNLVKEMTE